VALPTLSLKLTQTTALLVIVPLCLQLAYVAVLLFNFSDAEKEGDAEAASVKALGQTTMIFNDALNAASSLLMAHQLKDESYQQDFGRRINLLVQHRDQLANTVESNPEQARENAAFISVIDETKDLLVQASGPDALAQPLMRFRALAKLKKFMGRLNVAETEIRAQRLAALERSHEEQVQTRERLRLVVEIGSSLNILVVLTIVLISSRVFSKRMHALMINTTNIGTGKPLGEALGGSDELAHLDSVLHQLSKELSLSRQKERATIENAAEIISSLDKDLRITQINSAVMKILGLRPDAALGASFVSLAHDDDKKIVLASLENCKATYVETSFEARLRTQQGQYRFMSLTARWSEDAQSVFCFASDITERKESEKLKADVLAMINHDLRSSLNSLSITLELLTDGHLGELSEKSKKMITKADGSVKMLQGMISDLIEVDKIESLNFVLKCEKTPLSAIIQQAVDLMYGLAESKNIRIIIDAGELSIEADALRLRRVVLNLLNNAIKFSPVGATIFISGRETAGGGSTPIEVRVIDQGPGIPAGKVDFVFEKFKQLEGSPEEHLGSGLGLSICKAIVLAHGGKIGVDSAGPGGGSIFWFRIPGTQPRPQSEPSIF
jgi:PAS domain S-box-containing protein